MAEDQQPVHEGVESAGGETHPHRRPHDAARLQVLFDRHKEQKERQCGNLNQHEAVRKRDDGRILTQRQQEPLRAEPERAERQADYECQNPGVEQHLAQALAVAGSVRLRGDRVETEDQPHGADRCAHYPEATERDRVQ